jgi:hypothetical protein
LYLWHWPIWVFYRLYINNEMPTAKEAAALAAVSVAVALLSLWFVEQPMRKLRAPHLATISTGLLAAGSLVAVSIWVARSEGFPSRIPANLMALRSYSEMWNWPCLGAAPATRLGNHCTFGAVWSEARTKGVLWGDSHSTHMAPMIESLAKDENASILLYQPCPAIFDGVHVSRYLPEEPTYRSKCAAQRSEMLLALRENEDIDLVILASAWSYFPSALYSDDPSKRDGTLGLKLLERGLDEIVTQMAHPGRRVAIIGTVPQWPASPVPCELARAPLLRRPCTPAVLPRAEAMAFQQATDEAIARVADRHPNTIAVLPGIPLCESGVCLSKLNGEILYSDAGHIRLNLQEETKRQLSKLIGLGRIFAPPLSKQGAVIAPQ